MLLAGDVGGTNVRLALVDQIPSGFVRHETKVFNTAAFPDLRSIVSEFLKSIPGDTPPPESGCIGVPGRVKDGAVRLTNVPWALDEHEITETAALRHFRLVNDVQAAAASLPFLPPEDLAPIHLSPKLGYEGRRAVIAPGTGLGHAFRFDQDGHAITVPSEGGHALFAPLNDEQADLRGYLEGIYGSASVEHVVSGPGIGRIFDFLIETGRYPVPAELKDELLAPSADKAEVVSRWARERRAVICERAMDLFVDALASHAGNVALTVLATDGVYLGGGIPPKILPFLQDGRFNNAFVEKGKMRYVLEETPVTVIRDDRAALIGAASIAAEL